VAVNNCWQGDGPGRWQPQREAPRFAGDAGEALAVRTFGGRTQIGTVQRHGALPFREITPDAGSARSGTISVGGRRISVRFVDARRSAVLEMTPFTTTRRLRIGPIPAWALAALDVATLALLGIAGRLAERRIRV
jgi:hypothetical protein